MHRRFPIFLLSAVLLFLSAAFARSEMYVVRTTVETLESQLPVTKEAYRLVITTAGMTRVQAQAEMDARRVVSLRCGEPEVTCQITEVCKNGWAANARSRSRQGRGRAHGVACGHRSAQAAFNEAFSICERYASELGFSCRDDAVVEIGENVPMKVIQVGNGFGGTAPRHVALFAGNLSIFITDGAVLECIDHSISLEGPRVGQKSRCDSVELP